MANEIASFTIQAHAAFAKQPNSPPRYEQIFPPIRTPSNKHSLPKSNVWIVMGVCADNNTVLYNKAKFPYVEAALLAPRLWIQFFPDINVFVEVVYNGTEPVEYMRELRQAGAHVASIKSNLLDCASTAQASRLFAYRLLPDDAMLITSDVDAFPRGTALLEPIANFPNYSIYIWQWNLAEVYLCFVGARGRTWRNAMQLGSFPAQSLDEAMNRWIKINGEDTVQAAYNWGRDQKWMTQAVINQSLCSFSSSSKVWARFQLEPVTFDDSEICWQGHMGNTHQYGEGATWEHFYRHENATHVQIAFERISETWGNSSRSLGHV